MKRLQQQIFFSFAFARKFQYKTFLKLLLGLNLLLLSKFFYVLSCSFYKERIYFIISIISIYLTCNFLGSVYLPNLWKMKKTIWIE